MGLEKGYREIELPDSKEKLTVRGLKTLDYTYVGQMPDTLLATFMRLTGKKDVNVQDMDPESADFLVQCTMRGIVKQESAQKLSAKHPQDCGDDEFSFFDLSDKDQAELISSIFSEGEGLPLDFLREVGRKAREVSEGQNEKQAGG